jgi:hypothetical protein
MMVPTRSTRTLYQPVYVVSGLSSVVCLVDIRLVLFQTAFHQLSRQQMHILYEFSHHFVTSGRLMAMTSQHRNHLQMNQLYASTRRKRWTYLHPQVSLIHRWVSGESHPQVSLIHRWVYARWHTNNAFKRHWVKTIPNAWKWEDKKKLPNFNGNHNEFSIRI